MKKQTLLKLFIMVLPLFTAVSIHADSSLAFRGGGMDRGGEERNIEHPQAAQDARAYDRGLENGGGYNNNGTTLAPNTNWVAPDTTPGPLPPPNNPYPQIPR